MAKKPEVERPLTPDPDEFDRALDLIHQRLDVIEDHLINLGRSMGHIGIPSFKPYSGEEG